MCNFCKQNEIPLYVTLAKPVGTAREQAEWVCQKSDVDQLKFLETEYNVFTHMTPSYGQPGRCITVKGINTINHDGELIPCPYMDLSLGNVTKEPLSEAPSGRDLPRERAGWRGGRHLLPMRCVEVVVCEHPRMRAGALRYDGAASTAAAPAASH